MKTEKTTISKPIREISEETNPASTLTLNIEFQNLKGINFCYSNHPVSSTSYGSPSKLIQIPFSPSNVILKYLLPVLLQTMQYLKPFESKISCLFSQLHKADEAGYLWVLWSGLVSSRILNVWSVGMLETNLGRFVFLMPWALGCLPPSSILHKFSTSALGDYTGGMNLRWKIAQCTLLGQTQSRPSVPFPTCQGGERQFCLMSQVAVAVAVVWVRVVVEGKD